ncbi:MAG TPA: IclR family transcriptional regulator [Trebonia sp.]|jgi:DNA-binding IclR family transcriptional regulator|nr:IclR family transcriptional regulator [Trebonia sp.]
MSRLRTGESVLSRAVRILEAFSPGESALGVSEIARRAGLHPATASRLIAELSEHGLLARSADRRVRIGARMQELAARAVPARSLRDAALPFMRDAHAVIGHHVQLGVPDGREVLFLERLSAPRAVVNFARVAGRLPLHASSGGLVLLAHGPHELQESVLAAPLARFTAHTIVSSQRLRAVLAEVRREGCASCPGHVHEDALEIAVPVRAGTGPGPVVAALAAIVPVTANGQAVAGILTAAARGISRTIGGNTSPALSLYANAYIGSA